MIVAVTGHRPQKLGNEWDGIGPVSDRIRAWLRSQLIELKPTHAISGMALGVDQIFAELAIELKIPLIAAVPCANQDAPWRATSQKRYAALLAKAMQIVHVSEEYDGPKCMQRRNEWMVDHCAVLLAVWDGSKGGTANCVAYAERVQRQMIRFDPKA